MSDGWARTWRLTFQFVTAATFQRLMSWSNLAALRNMACRGTAVEAPNFKIRRPCGARAAAARRPRVTRGSKQRARAGHTHPHSSNRRGVPLVEVLVELGRSFKHSLQRDGRGCPTSRCADRAVRVQRRRGAQESQEPTALTRMVVTDAVSHVLRS